MRTRWIEREIAAPAATVWALLTDVRRWPEWGPSVRRAVLDGAAFELGGRGRVTTRVGLTLPFVVTAFEPGRSWSWEVAGVRATDHRLEALAEDRCRIGFGVPIVAWPYLVICAIALRRIGRLAEGGRR